jgi:hypothetical protein
MLLPNRTYFPGNREQEAESIPLDTRLKRIIDSLHMDDEEILSQFVLTLDGKKLSYSEAIRFLDFLRSELK